MFVFLFQRNANEPWDQKQHMHQKQKLARILERIFDEYCDERITVQQQQYAGGRDLRSRDQLSLSQHSHSSRAAEQQHSTESSTAAVVDETVSLSAGRI